MLNTWREVYVTLSSVLIAIKGNADKMSKKALDTPNLQTHRVVSAVTSFQYHNHVGLTVFPAMKLLYVFSSGIQINKILIFVFSYQTV